MGKLCMVCSRHTLPTHSPKLANHLGDPWYHSSSWKCILLICQQANRKSMSTIAHKLLTQYAPQSWTTGDMGQRPDKHNIQPSFTTGKNWQYRTVYFYIAELWSQNPSSLLKIHEGHQKMLSRCQIFSLVARDIVADQWLSALMLCLCEECPKPGQTCSHSKEPNTSSQLTS